MASLRIDGFAGIMPRTAPKLLDKVQAQTAHNCRLKAGRLEPVMKPSVDSSYPTGRCRIGFNSGVASVGLVTDPRTIHLWRFKAGATDGEYWLSWPGKVAVAQSTLADDERARRWLAGATGVSNSGGTVNNIPAVIAIQDGAGASTSCDPSKIAVRRVEKAPYATAPSVLIKDLYNPLASGSKPVITADVTFGGYISYYPLDESGNLQANRTTLSVGNTSQTLTGTITGMKREQGVITLKVSFAAHTETGSIDDQGGLPYASISGTKTRVVKISGVGVTNLEEVAPLFQSNNFGTEPPEVEGASVMGVYKDGHHTGTHVGELLCYSCNLDEAPAVVKDFSYAAGGTGGTGGLVQYYDATLNVTLSAWTCTIILYERYTENGTYGADCTWTNGTSFTHDELMKRFTDTTDGYYTEYIHTWVDDWGQESPPSDQTAQFFIGPGKYAEIQVASDPDASISDKRRIYRTFNGDWRFVTELESDSATAWWDNVSNEELVEVMPELENPPQDLDGIISLPGGFLCGYRAATKEICFTEPNLPYSWPSDYRLTVDHEPVALAASGNDIYVLTKGFPYVITGSHPDVMNIQMLPFPQACVSRDAVATLDGIVYYASPDGICSVVSGAVPALITGKYFSRRDWQELDPESMMMAAHDTALFVFCEKDSERLCYIIDFADGVSAITTSDETAECVCVDVNTDTLYYVGPVDGVDQILEWGGSATPKVFKWRSKRFQTPKPISYSCMKMTSDGYSTTDDEDEEAVYPIVRFFSGEAPDAPHVPSIPDGISKTSIVIDAQNARRIPMLRPERVFEFEIEHNCPVDDIVIATSMEECRFK